MKPFESELQCLSELYDRLDVEFASPGAAVDSILRNRELFSQIQLMNSRLLMLAEEWRSQSPGLEAGERERTQKLAQKLLQKALRLAHLGAGRAAEIESHRAKLGKELGEIAKGNKFLESVKPLKTNYPKFIDSRG